MTGPRRKKLSDQIADLPPLTWKPEPQILCSPELPLPMHGLAPRVIYGNTWWETTRYAAYRTTNYHCIACSVGKDSTDWCRHLEGHEQYEVDHLLGRLTYLRTVPLCPRCHGFIHPGYLKIQLAEGVISLVQYNGIMDYCYKVLQKAGLSKPLPYRGPTVEWSEWRLVLDDEEYPPLYADYKTYKEHYEP